MFTVVCLDILLEMRWDGFLILPDGTQVESGQIDRMLTRSMSKNTEVCVHNHGPDGCRHQRMAY